ncbi:MAG: diadenylate cyclase CdaA [Deltaproteobacteria bacterium]
MTYLALIEHLRVPDIVDILFLTVVVYYLFIWFRRTQAFKALIGLLVLGLVYTGARVWGLFLTTWVFKIFWQVLVILLIILFQSEIRQVLERVNPLRMIGFHSYAGKGDWISTLVQGVFTMAQRRIGALVIIERSDRIEEWVTACIPLQGTPSPEILLSIFHKESPLHDGAVVIREGRIAFASCFLPLSSSEGLPLAWGTRHRAALGLSERCDASVVVVSEERGEISLAREGKMRPLNTPEDLSSLLKKSMAPSRSPRFSWSEKMGDLILSHWKIKLGVLAGVTLVWLLLAGEQNFRVSLLVPLEEDNLPQSLKIVSPVNPHVEITFLGLRMDAATLTPKDIHAKVDLSRAGVGTQAFFISRDNISFPGEGLRIIHISPPHITFTFSLKKTEQSQTGKVYGTFSRVFSPFHFIEGRSSNKKEDSLAAGCRPNRFDQAGILPST